MLPTTHTTRASIVEACIVGIVTQESWYLRSAEETFVIESLAM